MTARLMASAMMDRAVSSNRAPPVGNLRDFHIGDGQQLVADLTLMAAFWAR